MAVAIREASDDDIQAILELSRSIQQEQLAHFRDVEESEEALSRLFEAVRTWPNSIVFVAEENARIVGELSCVARGQRHSEFVVFVHSEHRCSGVGRALVERLLDWARSQPSLERLQAWVVASNSPSMGLLVGAGFQELPEDRRSVEIRGHRVAELKLVLDLPAS